MKRLFPILFLFVASVAFAQEPIEVKVETRPSSMGIHPAFEVKVPQAEANDAIRLWEKTIVPKKLFQKTPKMVKQKDEWIVNDVVISDITSIPLKVLTQISSFKEHIYVRIFMQTEGGFLGSEGSSAETTDAANRFVRDYAVELYKQAVAKELKHEENKLSALENDLSRLSKQNRNYNKKISEASTDQKELKQEVTQNEMLLKEDPNAIQLLPEEGNGNKEELEKQLKSSEKDLKKAQRTESKFERKANKNEKDQKDKASEIAQQKRKVSEVRMKYENIR